MVQATPTPEYVRSGNDEKRAVSDVRHDRGMRSATHAADPAPPNFANPWSTSPAANTWNRFVIHGREYGVAHIGGVGFAGDPRDVRLADFRLRVGERFLYEYDFTGGWRYDVRVEQLLPLQPALSG